MQQLLERPPILFIRLIHDFGHQREEVELLQLREDHLLEELLIGWDPDGDHCKRGPDYEVTPLALRDVEDPLDLIVVCMSLLQIDLPSLLLFLEILNFLNHLGIPQLPGSVRALDL